MKLIDKDALVAEIEKLIERAKAERVLYPKTILAAKNYLLIEDYKKLLSFIDTLEVKEVDFKPIDDNFERDAVQFCFDNGLNTTPRIARTIAKYFFELGLKTQNKITPLQQQRISVMKMEFWTGLQTFNESEMTLSDAYNKGIEDVLEELELKVQKKE